MILSIMNSSFTSYSKPDSLKMIFDPRFCLAKFGLLRPVCVSRQMIGSCKKGHSKQAGSVEQNQGLPFKLYSPGKDKTRVPGGKSSHCFKSF